VIETMDTIVAAATPPGVGGISVVRISGPAAEAIASAMLGSLPEPRRATHLAFFGARGEQIDSGIALYFPAPGSFTGEPVLELQGHGGPVVVGLLVDAAVALGARLAGRFSMTGWISPRQRRWPT
jgi:tRNA modification GTPase